MDYGREKINIFHSCMANSTKHFSCLVPLKQKQLRLISFFFLENNQCIIRGDLSLRCVYMWMYSSIEWLVKAESKKSVDPCMTVGVEAS